MTESHDKNPSTGLGGANMNLLQINLDSAEPNKLDKDSINENDILNSANRPKFVIESDLSPSKSDKSNKILQKKTRRPKGKKTSHKDSEHGKLSNKGKLILKIYNEFKSSSSLIKEFPQFGRIEKNVKANMYASVSEFAVVMRNLFSEIFYDNSFDGEKYKKTLILCDFFEKIYKNYDNKIFQKESKNLVQIINKLKKELKQTEEYRNVYNEPYAQDSQH